MSAAAGAEGEAANAGAVSALDGLAALDARDAEPRTPLRRLGSTRKLAAFSNIRLQLAEQSRVLEARAEAAAGVAAELGDYCRRRADLEHEYARALDKLARGAAQRHRDQRHRREQWPLTGAFACWQAALAHTRALARDHAALGELYGGALAARLQRAADDVLRLHRKCRDVLAERHDELGAALAEAAAAGKAHAQHAQDWRAAALKLRHAHDQRAKLAAADPPRPRKLKALDKELDKRRARHSAARARALRARADYVLSLEAANATLQRYYLDDIADIMLCMEVGFEAAVGRAARTAGAAEAARAGAAGVAAGALMAAAEALDAPADRQRVLSAHAAAFAPPRALPYRGTAPAAQDAEMLELLGGAAEEDATADDGVAAELAARLQQLEAAARALRAECCENAKTLDAAEAELVRQMEGGDIDVSALFGATPPAASLVAPPAASPAAPDDDAPRRDQEDYYLAKFRSYVSCAGRLARLESKAAAVRARLLGGAPGEPRAEPPAPPRRAQPRRGLFAAPLDDRLPAVLTSCVRVIATYGLRHQGIFRVSGSQVEMQALRAAFERGEDPLRHVRDASDINSVCGLLKLYLRELRPPLVPAGAAERLLRVAAEGASGGAARLREALAVLPRPNMLVLRYLAAFLAHLAEHSEHNMMDAWNLAICLGPTLLAARGEGGAQVAAQNLVNELLKRIILQHAELFPQDIAPHALYARPDEAGAETEAEGAADADEAPPEDEADGRDDLSLYADDDDELSSDGDSGEWREHEHEQEQERGATQRRRSLSADAQPAPAHAQINEPSAAAPALAAAAAAADDEPAPATCRRLAEATPDLVLDLPQRAPEPPAARAPPPAPPERAPPPADSADTFAHNCDTLKKRPAHKHSAAEGAGPGSEVCGAGEGQGQGSPVPARNTARVAAKFAELTLTGGSLKPALAAKPALLRRPTPHPQHARAASAPAPLAEPEPRAEPDAAC